METKLDKVEYVAKKFPYTTLMTWEFYNHKHSFWEIIICRKGSAYHFIDEEKYTFSEGDIIIMKPGNSHDYKIQDKLNYMHYDLYSDSNLMQSACDTLSEGLYENLISEKKPLKMTVDKTSLDYLESKLSKLNSMQANEQFNDLAALYHKNIIYLICGLITENTELEKSNIPLWLSTLLSQMSAPEIICGDIGDIVKLSNFSHGHLCKLFKKFTGQKLIDYFTKLKIDYATVLLKNKEMNILDISCMLGYDSFSHFIHLFKKYNGITPKQYRKKLLMD